MFTNKVCGGGVPFFVTIVGGGPRTFGVSNQRCIQGVGVLNPPWSFIETRIISENTKTQDSGVKF